MLLIKFIVKTGCLWTENYKGREVNVFIPRANICFSVKTYLLWSFFSLFVRDDKYVSAFRSLRWVHTNAYPLSELL